MYKDKIQKKYEKHVRRTGLTLEDSLRDSLSAVTGNFRSRDRMREAIDTVAREHNVREYYENK